MSQVGIKRMQGLILYGGLPVRFRRVSVSSLLEGGKKRDRYSDMEADALADELEEFSKTDIASILSGFWNRHNNNLEFPNPQTPEYAQLLRWLLRAKEVCPSATLSHWAGFAVSKVKADLTPEQRTALELSSCEHV